MGNAGLELVGSAGESSAPKLHLDVGP